MAELKKFKLDFNRTLLSLDGEVQQTLKSSVKAGSVITEDMFENLKANKLVALAIANGSEELAGKEFLWMKTLYTEGVLELDIVDTRTLKNFIGESRKKAKQNFTNIVLMQLNDIFDVAGFKEK